MTLILAMGGSRETVLVADRRVTANGKLFDDDSNKAAVIAFRDARLAVAFTGLAAWGAFNTERWLLAALMQAAAPEYLAGPTIDRFRVRATNDIARLRIADPGARCLAVVFAGYRHGEEGVRLFYRKVESFSTGGGHFTIQLGPDPSGTHAYMIVAGSTQALPPSAPDALRPLVESGRPARAVVEKAVDVIRAAADSPRAAGVIGKQCSSLVVPCDPNEPCAAAYHSSEVSDTIYMPAFANITGPGAIVSGVKFKAGSRSEAGPVLVVPKVGRNVPCPCGSGTKYKKCHGRDGPRGPTFTLGR